jgi:hypothetical protein
MDYPPVAPPRNQGRGVLIVIGALLLVLVAVIAAGAYYLVSRHSDPAPPANPRSVEFRRVLKATPGACPSPPPASVYCGKDMRYTLGKVEIDASHVTEVKAEESTQGTPYWYVALSFDAEGKQFFGQLTTELAKKPAGQNLLAIVVRNEVVAAPVVNAPITGGQVQISGAFSKDDVQAMVKKITG